jgi:hypothetical protein
VEAKTMETEVFEQGSKEDIMRKIEQAFADMAELSEMSNKINKKIDSVREFITTYAELLKQL